MLYLANPRGTRPAKLRKPKPDQRVGNEWFTQDRDAGSANDHHTPVKWQTRRERRAGERDMNTTSEKRTRQDSCVKELELPAKGTSTCTDMPSEAEAQTKYKPITQRNCPKSRGPSGKPWSDWYKTLLSFRIGSFVELVDAAAAYWEKPKGKRRTRARSCQSNLQSL